MKDFVKPMDPLGSGIQNINCKFLVIIKAKRKNGIFVGQQKRQLMRDPYFERSLNECETAAWRSFKNVVKNFLGKEQTEYYKQLVSDLLQKFRKLGFNVSKDTFFGFTFKLFPENLGDVSDE